jgi:hypothetical protein
LSVLSCVSLGRIVRTAFSSGTRRKPPMLAQRAGVADRWLDAPG